LFQTTAPLLRHWKSIPQPLAELLERCLSELPEERPKDFAVVGRCFARLQQGDDHIPVVGAAPVRPAPATAVQTVPVVRAVQRVAEPADDYRDRVAPQRAGGGGGAGKILFLVFGGLALLFLFVCGGGAA